jgi:putative oxidoreductase
MQKQYQGFITLLGRLLLAPLFLYAGYNHITSFEKTKGYMTPAMPMPLPDSVVTVLLGIACFLLVAGGLLLLFGWQGRVGALFLILFLIPVTLLMHNFWAATGEQAQQQLGHFMSNFGLVGGLLFVMAFGPGPYSIDGARAAKLK